MNEETIRIFKKMCECVGADFDSIDFSDDGEYDPETRTYVRKPWYHQYEWTEEQEQEFKEWLMEELKKRKVQKALGCLGGHKTYRTLVANFFLLQWGWKTEEKK
jgi:site-specific DNA-adenine methylase